ncbi:MAG: hypothetical protein ACRD3V_06445 [Vicinamibacteria bacterium]
MGLCLTALSYEATAYSAWLVLGFPGRAFTMRISTLSILVVSRFTRLTWRRVLFRRGRRSKVIIPSFRPTHA